MAIEIEYSNFKSQTFNSAIRKLSNYSGFSSKMAYEVSKIIKEIKKAEGIAQKEYTEMIQGYSVKDEKGEIVPSKDEEGNLRPGTFDIIEGKQAELEKAHLAFGEQTAKIERQKLSIDDLNGVGLNPNEIMALEPMLHGLEIIEGEYSGKIQSIKKGKDQKKYQEKSL